MKLKITLTKSPIACLQKHILAQLIGQGKQAHGIGLIQHGIAHFPVFQGGHDRIPGHGV